MKCKFKNLFMAVLAVLFFVACDSSTSTSSSATASASEDAELQTIMIGGVQADGSTYFLIPMDIYGESDEDLEGAFLDLYINGALVLGDMDPSDYYNPISNTVTINFSPISAGAILGFGITTNNGAELYFEGVVEEDSTSEAIITERDFSENEEEEEEETEEEVEKGEVGNFFDEMQSATGSGSGDRFSATYAIQFGGYAFSEDCEAEFVKELDFYVDTSLSNEEIAASLITGIDGPATTVIISQSDGIFTWDDVNSITDDFIGIIDNDGTFISFDGFYVDEENYSYSLYEGTIERSVGITGTLTAKAHLNGEKLLDGLEGSCTMTSEITGTVE